MSPPDICIKLKTDIALQIVVSIVVILKLENGGKRREIFQCYLVVRWVQQVLINSSLWLIKNKTCDFPSLLRTFRGCRRRRWDIWYWMALQHRQGPRRSTRKMTKAHPSVQCRSTKQKNKKKQHTAKQNPYSSDIKSTPGLHDMQ